jgi:predicted nucleotidyltransferase
MMKALQDYLRQNQAICFAFLFGSRARGFADVHDWDLALAFNQTNLSKLSQLARIERTRSELSKVLKEPADRIDLVDVARAPLNLCVTIAAEGQILKGSETLELFRFYQRAWRGQEEFYLRQAHGY